MPHFTHFTEEEQRIITGATVWSDGVNSSSIKEKLQILTWMINAQSVRPEVLTEIDRINRESLSLDDQHYMHGVLAPIVIEQVETRLSGSAEADVEFKQDWADWSRSHDCTHKVPRSEASSDCYGCVTDFLTGGCL